jgi:hypothetical protein
VPQQQGELQRQHTVTYGLMQASELESRLKREA